MNEFREVVSGHGSVEGEIKLADVIAFFAKWWKLILGTGAVGAIAAVIFTNSQSPLYQAKALVLVAEKPYIFVEDKHGLTPLSYSSSRKMESQEILLESPHILLERLTIPTTYPSEIISECQFSSQDELLLHIKDTSADLNKGTFRFSVLHHSPKLATQCAEALFRMIQSQEAELAKTMIENLSFGSTAVKVMLPGAPTRLAAPAYASDESVFPQKKRLVAAWCASGLFAGLLIALLWTVVTWYRRKAVSNSQPID